MFELYWWLGTWLAVLHGLHSLEMHPLRFCQYHPCTLLKSAPHPYGYRQITLQSWCYIDKIRYKALFILNFFENHNQNITWLLTCPTAYPLIFGQCVCMLKLNFSCRTGFCAQFYWNSPKITNLYPKSTHFSFNSQYLTKHLYVTVNCHTSVGFIFLNES